ncbi:MAG TPA: hypothetical protein VFS91_01465 [Nitrobacter sp.]|nr:hypothetical protein [Nitrobacter sp.]
MGRTTDARDLRPAEPYDDYNDGERGIGCYECDQGWKHGCCDDMCIACTEAPWCDDAYPCRLCNPHGDFLG